MPEEDIKELEKYINEISGGSKRSLLLPPPAYAIYRILDVLCLIIEEAVPA